MAEPEVSYKRAPGTSGDSTVPRSSQMNCAVCGNANARKCTKCKIVAYCGKECQSKDWPTHKLTCNSNQQKQTDRDKLQGLSAKASTSNHDRGKTRCGVSNQTAQLGNLLGPETSSEKLDDANKGDEDGPQTTTGAGNYPDIGSFLSDQSILNYFLDPEIDKALTDIKNDPLKIQNYKDSEKLKNLIEKITQKLDLGVQNASPGQI